EFAETKGTDVRPTSLRGRRRLGAPQDGADARQELPRTEGLGEIVISAELEPHDTVGFVPDAGQHDERNERFATQTARDLHTVLASETQFEDHEIDRRILKDTGHLCPARG